ncbi:MAG: winged helix-turn-helix domain-containing protein [Candidatus Bathyarchaeia archaeon]|jgi:hypothetical protein
MPSGLESLHKVLKDEKRRKIVELLNEKGSLSYTDLMVALGISNTGKLNYHLKVLNELVTKDSEGLYVLTEKGKLAANLVQELATRKSQSQTEAPFPRGYMIVVSLFSVAVIAVDFGLFLSGLILLEQFATYLLTAVLAFVFLVAAEKARIKRSIMQPKRQMRGAQLSIIAAGAFAGAVGLFFGGGLLLAGLVQLGFHSPFPTFNSWIIVSFTLGAVIGGTAGYTFFKQSKYSDPRYYEPF